MSFGVSDVVESGLCVGCGACSVRTNGAIPVTIGRLGVYQANLEGATAQHLAQADRVCPFSDRAHNEDEIADRAFGGMPRDARLGHYREVLAGRLVDEPRLLGSSSGSLTSFVIGEMLRTGVVDGVLHVGRATGTMFSYQASYTMDEVLEKRKSLYYSTTLADVLAQVRGDQRKYVVVGVPCFIKALRLLADEDADLDSQFAFYVGLVCGHLKSQFFAESLAWQVGIAPDHVDHVDFRVKNPGRSSNAYDYEATSVQSSVPRTRSVPSTVDGNWGYGAFQPEACNFCDDIFAETADVVFGDAWLPQYQQDWRGTNVVVVRNETIGKILHEAVAAGVAVLDTLTPTDAAKSQDGNFRHRRVGLRVRLADDIAAGKKVPTKRVRPGYDGVTRGRIAVIRLRRRMSRESLELFARARAAGDYSLYLRPMRRFVVRYKLTDAAGRGPVRLARQIVALLLKR